MRLKCVSEHTCSKDISKLGSGDQQNKNISL